VSGKETGGFVLVAAAKDIADGAYVIRQVGEHSVLIVNLGGQFFAVENRCAHVSSPLDGGRVRRGRIACPLHGAIYDLRTGAALSAALSPRGLRTFAVRLEEGVVAIGSMRSFSSPGS
jgi:3-phenylpropionate/trans-cinnamate dioxygenase ferredoxin subunit